VHITLTSAAQAHADCESPAADVLHTIVGNEASRQFLADFTSKQSGAHVGYMYTVRVARGPQQHACCFFVITARLDSTRWSTNPTILVY
jgi:hypothetical protein